MTEMNLKILLPSRVLVDCKARKVVAEAANGSFGILPRHIDFVTALVPGILSYVDTSGTEFFVGVDEGILVKRRDEVTVSAVEAIEGENLEHLREKLDQRHQNMEDHERSARSALARLEAGVVKRFLEFSETR